MLMQEDREKLIAKLQNSERQIEMLKLQIDQEKAKYSDLENLLAKERVIQHESHLRMQNLEKEKNDYKSEIARLTGRIAGILYNSIIGLESTMKSIPTPSPK